MILFAKVHALAPIPILARLPIKISHPHDAMRLGAITENIIPPVTAVASITTAIVEIMIKALRLKLEVKI